jgi:uncharacterized protein UPF0547
MELPEALERQSGRLKAAGLVAGVLVAAVGAVVGVRLTRFGLRAARFAFRAATFSLRKRCPDCAERIKVDARVCRHCGYRFD